MNQLRSRQSSERIVASIGTIAFPEDFQPIDATQMRGQFMVVNWKGGSKAADAQGRARLVMAIPKAPNGKMQINRSRNDFGLHRDIKIDSDDKKRETLSWQFAGQSRDVEKTIEPAEKGGFNTIRYQAKKESTDKDPGFTLILVVRDPGRYAEQDVQKIFESFQPNSQTTTKRQ